MRLTAGDSTKGTAGDSFKIEVHELREMAAEWLSDCLLRNHAKGTIEKNKDALKQVFWFFEKHQIDAVGTNEIKKFFLYLQEAHLQSSGRWDNPNRRQPLRPTTIHFYYRVLRSMFNYLFNEEMIERNPMRKVKPPLVRSEIKQPLSNEHVSGLLRAAKKSEHAKRDTAIVLVLLDSGIRANELCSLRVCDYELESRSLKIFGKGNKIRTVFLGIAATKAVNSHLRRTKASGDAPLFLSHKNVKLTASGIYQLLDRLSKMAGIKNYGVHALRRTFAVNMLREGANVFTVQQLMGHSDLSMTRKYCAIAEADIAQQHAKFSPADRLNL